MWSRNWKSKSRRRRNVVEKSQSESKTFDAIDVGHYSAPLQSVLVTKFVERKQRTKLKLHCESEKKQDTVLMSITSGASNSIYPYTQ